MEETSKSERKREGPGDREKWTRFLTQEPLDYQVHGAMKNFLFRRTTLSQSELMSILVVHAEHFNDRGGQKKLNMQDIQQHPTWNAIRQHYWEEWLILCHIPLAAGEQTSQLDTLSINGFNGAINANPYIRDISRLIMFCCCYTNRPKCHDLT